MTLTAAPLSLFWYWMDERHRIFLKRQAGEPKPWTDDPILRDYKFTNPFRQNDRGTVWLTENFLKPHAECPECDGRGYYLDAPANVLEGWSYDTPCQNCIVHAGELVFNVAWYRMFNWWGTGQLLGWQTAETWNPETVKELLRVELRNGRQVFTGAHIVYSPPGQPKIDAIVDVCDAIFRYRRDIANIALNSKSLEKTFGVLTKFHCVGGFMAYEMVTDLRHTRLLRDATDIYTWANPGPGAIRGLKRLYPVINASKRLVAIGMIQALQDRLRTNEYMRDWDRGTTPISFNNYAVEMRDIEHSLCEFDKYCRVKFGEGKPRSMFNGRV